MSAFLALSTLTLAPGITTRTIEVTIKGDTLTETNERFFLDLSTPTNATIADTRGTGTISTTTPRHLRP